MLAMTRDLDRTRLAHLAGIRDAARGAALKARSDWERLNNTAIGLNRQISDIRRGTHPMSQQAAIERSGKLQDLTRQRDELAVRIDSLAATRDALQAKADEAHRLYQACERHVGGA